MNPPEFNRIYVGRSEELLRTWPENCVDAVVTDPPYGLGKEPDPRALLKDWLDHGYHEVGGAGFMGKSWDAFVPQPALWAEVFRVMKPGAHLLAFSGTRTYDWMVLAIRLAGFEIRDQAQWLYGQGFPKSLNVSMQLDKMDSVETRRERALRFTGWMRSTGITSKLVNKLTASNMAGHYLTDKEQPEIATGDMFDLLRPHLPEVPEDIEELVRWRTVESENYKRREVTGTKMALDPAKVRLGVPGRDEAGRPLRGTKEITLTKAHTDLAKQWEGWGTALKPANEPIVLARKPLEGTVADNVMRWGVGAINIDAGRIPIVGEKGYWPGDAHGDHAGVATDFNRGKGEENEKGRWPANLIVMHSPDCLEVRAGEWACVTICPMRLMELQSPGSTKFFYVPKPDGGERNMGLAGAAVPYAHSGPRGHGLNGDGSPRKETAARGNIHPTVKPVDLMAYLIELVTPRGGVVLDPFMGSGTTGIAAARLRRPYLGCELSPEYAELAEKRIAAETAQGTLL